MDTFIPENSTPSTSECQDCYGIIDLKLTENDFNETSLFQTQTKICELKTEENFIKNSLEENLKKNENLVNEINLRIKEFSLLQYDHFADIKRDIDIQREMKIQNIYKNSSVNNKAIEILNKSSADLIKQVEKLEEAFRINFETEIRPKVINIDIETEKSNLKTFLKDSSLTKDFFENLNRYYDAKWRGMQKNYHTFDIFEFDLKRNKFVENTSDTLGKLDLFSSFLNFKDIIDAIKFSHNSNQIQVLNVNKNSTTKCLIGHSKGIFCVITNEKDRIISGAYDGKIKEFDLVTGECLKTLDAHSLSVTCLKMLKNGYLASSSNGGSIKIWDLSKSRCICNLNENSDGDVECLDQLSNGNLISGSDNGIIGIYDLEKQSCVNVIKDTPNWIKCLKILPQNDLFAAGGKTIKIWNCSSGECIKVLKGHSGLICGLELASNNLLISCSWDKTLRLWDLDLDSNVCIKEFLGHTDIVTCIKLSVNKRNLVYSASEDKTIKVWDLDSKECLQTIQMNLETKSLTFRTKSVNPGFVLNEF